MREREREKERERERERERETERKDERGGRGISKNRFFFRVWGVLR